MADHATLMPTPTAGPAFAFDPHASPVDVNERRKMLEDPGFGRVFTDHMATVRYSEAKGWHDPKIGPRAPFQMDSASAVLHYAQEIFEGLKAYRLEDGGTALFRPEENAARFRRSAQRMAMAELPEELFIASSAGNYFKSGTPAISLWVSEDYTRAAPGGTGAAKCGGNYATSLIAQAQATKLGHDQVLFLDAVERRWIEELGGMNIFFVLDDGSLVTPPLGGTILPGITRASLLTMARDLGLTAREEPYSIDQCRADAESGRLREAFACGTAAVLTPIGRMASKRGEFTIGRGGPGQTTMKLRQSLVDIQRGAAPDPHNWLDRLD